MIKTYSALEKNGIKIEVNYSDAVKPAKKFKFTIGDKSAVLDRKDFYTLMFLFGDIDQKSQLIPIKRTEMKATMHRAKARAPKDLKKGEIFFFMHNASVPMTETKEEFKIDNIISHSSSSKGSKK
jgi:hypothetical protein